MPKTSETKPHVLHREGYRFHFWMEGKGRDAAVRCNAYVGVRGSDGKLHYEEKPCLEWTFGKIPGNNILGNAAIYIDQALMYAKNPPN